VLALYCREQIDLSAVRRSHVELSIATQCLGKQLGVHGRVVGGKNPDAILQGKTGQLSHDGFGKVLGVFRLPAVASPLYSVTISF
jgi:hypothetical protein